MEMWIARDKNGELSIFKDKPIIRGGIEWCSLGEEYMGVTIRDSFPKVTFENSPQKVKIELCG